MKCALARGPMPPNTPRILSVIVARLLSGGRDAGSDARGQSAWTRAIAMAVRSWQRNRGYVRETKRGGELS
jgi:hypothetical protein